MLLCLKVEASFDCTGCRRQTAVAALDARCQCANCAQSFDGQPLWTQALSRELIALDALLGGKRSGLHLAADQGQGLVGRFKWWIERPICPGCGVLMDPAKILEAQQRSPGDFKCPRCQGMLHARRPPAPFLAAAPSMRLVLDEKELAFRSATMHVSQRAMTCECGRALDLMAMPERRVLDCHACHRRTRVPDDLWVPLQPNNDGKHFFLLFDEDALYARAVRDAGLDHERKLLLYAKAPLPHAALAELVPDIVAASAADDAAYALAMALASNRHVPTALVAGLRPRSAEEAWRLLEREDLPVERAFELLGAPIGATGTEEGRAEGLAALERLKAWKELVSKASSPQLTASEARLLMAQPYRPELRRQVVRNSALDLGIIAEEMQGGAVRQLEILENPAVPPDLLKQLAKGTTSDEVRLKAEAHPSYPHSIFKRLFGGAKR